jgi:hypothetical protein
LLSVDSTIQSTLNNHQSTIHLSRRSDVGRRRPETAAKLTIEGGDIAEAGAEGDSRDGAIGIPGIAEHAMHASKALTEHES